MNLKKLGIALAAVLALAALTASSAFAAAKTEAKPWLVGGKAITSPVTADSTGSGTLKTYVGATNKPVTLTASGIDCAGCTIFNTSGNAEGEGTLTFTGVKVTEPAQHCKVKEEMITTNPLKVEASYMIGSTIYVKFTPKSGTSFTTVVIKTDGTGSCPVSGSSPVTGVVYVKATNATGTYVKSQSVEASRAINEAGSGETDPLRVGGNKAELSGTSSFHTTPEEVFGVE